MRLVWCRTRVVSIVIMPEKIVRKHPKDDNVQNSELNMKRSAKAPKLSAQDHKELNPCSETSLDFIKRLNQDAPFAELPAPVKSANDKKEYKVIRLANGLTACLISDPTAMNVEDDDEVDDSSGSEYDEAESESDWESEEDDSDGDDDSHPKVPDSKMAAAALCVGVGSFSDPKEIQGLAHFLEHMVFMGSKKFPLENDFNSFILSKGGSENAFTHVETTMFNFECLKKHLYQSLDKFAQLFIAPLMLRGSITREREAVDSEFQQALPEDVNRKLQLFMNLAQKDSPVNTFTWGNMKTLRDNVDDKKLYEALHEFRKRHYSAHRMTLAIQAGLPIKLLEAYVLDCFSSVPSNNLPADDFSKFKNVYDTPEWSRIYFVEPTIDTTTVEITFSLPSLMDQYKTKSHYYVSGLLGEEGIGSLLSYLRKKVWVLSLRTGSLKYGCKHNSLYSMFAVDLHLTAEGLRNLFSVIEAVFSYINMIRAAGPQERIYNEMKQIEEIDFRFADEQPVDENVEELANNMQHYPSEDYLTGPNLFYEYDPKGIGMVLDHLVPHKANITVTTKGSLVFKELNGGQAIQYDKTETWFGTKYADLAISEELLNKWALARPLDEFALPQPNQFLTKDFDILPAPTNFSTEYPVAVIESDAMELWHRQDVKFLLPTAVWYMNFVSVFAVKTTKNKAMLDFYVHLVDLYIAEEAWPAKNARLSYKMWTSENGMVINVSGLNEKLPILLDLLVKHLKLFTSNLTEETFAAVKDNQIRMYRSLFLEPTTLANDNIDNLMMQKCLVMDDVTIEDMKTFAVEFLKKLYLRVLVQGNVSSSQAVEVSNKIMRDLNYSPVLKSDYPQRETVQVPQAKQLWTFRPLNKTDTNSVVAVHYPTGEFNIECTMLMEMVELLIEEPLFDTLRTKEQLGHSIVCSVRAIPGVLGLFITVTSSADKFSTVHVEERIEAFLKRALQILKDTTEDEFKAARSDLIKKKQCADNSLAEEASRNWSEIDCDLYMFHRLKHDVKCLEKLKRSHLIDWWKANIYCDEKDRFTDRKLSTHVVGYTSEEIAAAAAAVESDNNNINEPAGGSEELTPVSQTITCVDPGLNPAGGRTVL